ncbi:hypothetical protein E3N88_03629 [Mikania micrantha]|uniref:t-SNARE coiled-coil homology domain-containing protein n=1 Tax=Mikania micrantha TaxID=192012 RepID=A0A5N6Q7G6_9ASTR|nr:hypothetical protein E3N88_03629 [Mikania micrantha]
MFQILPPLVDFQRWSRIRYFAGTQVNFVVAYGYNQIFPLDTYLFPFSVVLRVWKVDELEKAISVASRDPSLYGINEVELEKRRKWSSTARIQVANIKKAVSTSSFGGMRQELMRMPKTHHQDRNAPYVAIDNDDFISSESDRQMLLIKQQDEELDELSASVERIGSVGLTIHDELIAQEKIIEELGSEMDSTSNRLDFVQVGFQ